jgi:hypothetical protein
MTKTLNQIIFFFSTKIRILGIRILTKQKTIFVVLWRPFWKWRPLKICRCRESIQDVEIELCWICAVLWWPFWKRRLVEIQHSSISKVAFEWWYWTMFNFCGIVTAILKMVTGRYVGTSLSTHISNFDDIGQCWICEVWVDYDVPNLFPTFKNLYRSPFSKWPPQYRINSTLSNFNDISYVGRLWCPDIQKFLAIGQCWICEVLWWPFLKWWPVEIFRCQESFRDIIIYPHMKSPFSKGPPQYCTNSTLFDFKDSF